MFIIGMKSNLTFVQIRNFILILLLLSCVLLTIGAWFHVHEGLCHLLVLGVILVSVSSLFPIAVLIHYAMPIFAKEHQTERQTEQSMKHVNDAHRHNMTMQKDNIYISVKK